MLAELRAEAVHLSRRFRQPDGQAADVDLPLHFLAEGLHEIAVLPGLLVAHHIGKVVDRTRRDAASTKRRHEFRVAVLERFRFDGGDQCLMIVPALCRARKIRGEQRRGLAQGTTQRGEAAVFIALADVNPLATRRIQVPERVRRLPARVLQGAVPVACEISLQLGRGEIQLRAVEGSVEALPLAGASALVERESDPQRRHDASIGVARAHTQVNRRLARFTEARHDPGECLYRHVERGLRDFAEPAVAGVRGVHELRVDRRQLLVRQVPPGNHLR